MERKKYPIRPEDYELYEIVGQGVSAAVYRARCIPLEEIVAIKILDFERSNSDLSTISREAQTMILIDHPNVLKAHCSFVNDHELWVVMPYMAGGSCLHIMKSVYPDGFEEVVIATVLREVLKGLEYLHAHGHIHRDVKAGNILVDARLGIKLGDFGVSACLFDSGDRLRARNTIVGTPCWMAPEVLQQLHGYDFKADIWSFGITALELAHGRAPFSKYPPMKILLMTLQYAPPGLDYERDKKFSRSFKQMIAMCLVKDPSKRPTAKKLLKQPFFKQARSQDYIARKILDGLPTLGDRVLALKAKEEDLLAQQKMGDDRMEELSQNEYKKGISSWNFDIEVLKSQASLVTDNEDTILCKDSNGCPNPLLELDTLQERMPEGTPFALCCSLKDCDTEGNGLTNNKSTFILPPDQTCSYQRYGSDGSDSESKTSSTSDQSVLQNGFQSPRIETGHFNGSCKQEIDENIVENAPMHSCNEGESLKQPNQLQGMRSFNIRMPHTVNGVLAEATSGAPKSAASNADDLDDKQKQPVVQQKGRFKVTSENVDLDKALPSFCLQKCHSLQVIPQFSTSTVPSSAEATSNVLGFSIFPQLCSVLQANIIQRDYILGVMKQLSSGGSSAVTIASANCPSEVVSLQAPMNVTDKSLLEAAHEREKELIQDITDLQYRLLCMQDELQKLKTKNAQV